MSDNIVIIGAGQAGVQLADSLRTEGYSGAITLFSDEVHAPYQRPPLSKDFMSEAVAGEALPLRGARFFSENAIEFRAGVTVHAIDRVNKTVTASDGSTTAYTELVFATGARNRRLEIAGSELDGVHYLRTLDEAITLQDQLSRAHRVVVIGAGFIGLEFAASARLRGLHVTVLEFAPRLMGRVLSEPMSDYFAAHHSAAGIDLRLGEGIVSFTGTDGRVASAVSTSGAVYQADLVVVGIGVLPNTELALESGLEIANGIVVDSTLCTADPHVHALGDCANFPSVRDAIASRIESVQNATDQSRALAKTLSGSPTEYRSIPWFWSQQGSARLQIAGIVNSSDDAILRGDIAAGRFSIYCFRGDSLAGVESVNSPADHLAARRMLEGQISLSREQAADSDFDIKAHSKSAVGIAG